MKTFIVPDIHLLMQNQEYFNSFVYTSREEAIKQLELRKGNKEIQKYIQHNLPDGIPAEFAGEKNAVIGRQIATPNFEMMKFFNEAEKLTGFKKTVIVMHRDKFTPGNNQTKYHLGKLVFSNEEKWQQCNNTKSIMSVDFNENAGKKFLDVNTIWGQGLVDFHNELLQISSIGDGGKNGLHQFEGSDWLKKLGDNAKEYYPKLLALFLANGILFENFLLKEKGESAFTKEVFLTAFIHIIKETGFKPLIVSFLPLETEGSNFWNFYPGQYYSYANNKMKMHEMINKRVAA
jgi:hypothetical protein